MTNQPTRKILVLLDGPEIRREAVRYAVELAKRTESSIFLLMILRRRQAEGPDGSDEVRGTEDAMCEAAAAVLKRCVDETRACGAQVDGMLRQGDPASEFLKFLAGFRPCHAVVWGGSETFLRGGRKPVRGHWLERIRDELDCTLVVPSLKRKR